ncbi:MAG: cytochrome c [Acidobacteria bacterium]|nr:cytochrome c [Acidobacteriota bacterium]
MSKLKQLASGWRGICLVAITYVYFLIFAQFAFLHRLATLGIADTHLKLVMASMAIGGILFSLIAARLQTATPPLSPSARLRAALILSAAAALLTLLPLNLFASLAVAFLIGTGLGLLTVTLVTHLPTWLGPTDPILQVGLGTGLGYFICNFPPIFAASPQTQSFIAATLCLLGLFAVGIARPMQPAAQPQPALPPPARTLSFPIVLACFTALVWLDSAAFFIIQSTPALKAGTWVGSAHLWLNGSLHLAAAIASALLLRRRGIGVVLSTAFLALAIACLLLLDPNRALLASLFYPVGVSLYSVALVAYPALLFGPATLSNRAHRAGWIYAIAGWIGSAMGIGMAQNLRHVPVAFVAIAGTVILGPQISHLTIRRSRELTAVAAILTLSLLVDLALRAHHTHTPPLSAIERGRRVYIAEGCINCHSQYIRPNSTDVLMWGPAQTIEELRQQHPPLIGNRRQGPDLSEVGGRRSPLWLRAHFYKPRQVSHASFMPSYKYLFQNSNRGNDLIAYLNSLKSPTYPQHIQAEQAWHPSAAAVASANPTTGAHLFANYCATCHQSNGLTRQTWHNDFKHLPPTLSTGSWSRLQPSDTPAQRQHILARIIKFGIPGTDMPGHEYLPDNDVADIALWLSQSIAQPHQSVTNHTTTGELQ